MSEAPVSPQRIFQLGFSYTVPLMMKAAVDNGIFDALDAGSMTSEAVAEKTGTDARAVRILLNGLIAVDLVARESDGRYRLTPESAAFLVSGKPAYFGHLMRHHVDQILPKFLQLPRIIKTGKPASAVNQEGPGSEFFAQFVESIFPNSYPAAQALGEHLKVSSADRPIRVLDLAAGSGVWGIALAQKWPRVLVTAVDWPGVLPVTRKMTERFGVADRFTYSPGDLRSADFGKDQNIATLGHILHSEGVAASQALLRKTFAAMAAGGTIAIAEMLCDEGRSGPPHALIFAVNMLVNTDAGDTFTFGEISDWLREAGFINPRLLPVPGPSPLILADKPGR
jgi:hypothetical protein